MCQQSRRYAALSCVRDRLFTPSCDRYAAIARG